ncbi:MAG: hypothetical protein EOP62_04815 [Sphingomonadales bacterium]|nr:MAG: hypothetical protein EOP62_04815 [Sphingomonadales bacterium]
MDRIARVARKFSVLGCHEIGPFGRWVATRASLSQPEPALPMCELALMRESASASHVVSKADDRKSYGLLRAQVAAGA